MRKRTREEQQKDDIRVLIEEAKIRNGLNEGELSRCLGISTTTLSAHKRDPGGITFNKLLILLELSGRDYQIIKGGKTNGG